MVHYLLKISAYCSDLKELVAIIREISESVVEGIEEGESPDYIYELTESRDEE